MNENFEVWKNYYIRYLTEKIEMAKTFTKFDELAISIHADSSITVKMLEAIFPCVEPDRAEDFIRFCYLIRGTATEKLGD